MLTFTFKNNNNKKSYIMTDVETDFSSTDVETDFSSTVHVPFVPRPSRFHGRRFLSSGRSFWSVSV